MDKSEPHGHEALVCDYLSRLLGTPIGANHPYCAEALERLEVVLTRHRTLFAEANKPTDASGILQQLRTSSLAFHNYGNCDLLEDVFLALLMEHGENEAYRYFEGKYGHDVRAWARYYAPRDPAFADSVLGALYVPRAKSEARIATYKGDGPLRGWLKKVVWKLAHPRPRRIRTVQLVDDGVDCCGAQGIVVGHRPSGPVDNEIDRRNCRDLLAPAFRGCFDAIKPADRLLLKQVFVDRVHQNLIAMQLGVKPCKIFRRKENAIKKVERRFHKLVKTLPGATRERVAECLELLRQQFSDLELDLDSVLGDKKKRNKRS